MNDLDSDSGSQIGVEMLFNPKKIRQGGSGLSDNLSVKSIPIADKNVPPRFVDLAETEDGDDIDVRSAPSDDGFRPAAANRQAFSEVSESEGGFNTKQPQYSGEDILNMKREILYQLNRLEKRGVSIPRKFTLSSSLEEMKTEYERLKRDMEVDASIRFQKKMLMAAVSGIEFLNDKFDPFDVHLNGWSESFGENIEDYSDVFEELHDKYKGKAKMAPELRLLFGVGGSAVFFHLSQSMFKTIPGMDQVFHHNPELRRQVAEATLNTMNQQQQSAGPSRGGTSAFSGLMNMFGGFGGATTPGMSQQQAPRAPQAPQAPQERPSMRGPTNVDSLLSELQQENFTSHQNDRLEVVSNASESELTEMDDDASINGLLLSKKRKSKRRTLDI